MHYKLQIDPDKLGRHLAAAHMTGRQLCREAGVAASSLSRAIEQGVSPRICKQLAEALGCPLDELLIEPDRRAEQR